MFWVYAISSIKRNYIYVGLTKNLERRIYQHNKGYEKTTKPYAPFQLIFCKEYSNRIEARKGEKYYKSGIGKEFLKSFCIASKSKNE
ncbi:MAG: GIY-YIG nuclease family protein [Bacteroidota bacterium]